MAPIISRQDAAKLAKVTVRTIRRWQDAKLLATYRSGVGGKTVGVDEEELKKFLEDRATFRKDTK